MKNMLLSIGVTINTEEKVQTRLLLSETGF